MMLRAINSQEKTRNIVNSVVSPHTPRQCLASPYTFVGYLASLVARAFVSFLGGQQMFVRSEPYSILFILLDAEGSPSYLKVLLKGFSKILLIALAATC